MHKFSGPTSPIIANLDVDHTFVMVYLKYKYVKASFFGMLVCDNKKVYWKIMHVDHINENALNCVEKIDVAELQDSFNYSDLEKVISCTHMMFEKSCNVTFYVAETMAELFHTLNEIKNSSWKVSQ